ncbi:MAG: acyl-CoA dehydrogenase family protein, partial [Novosphingobium sp.]
MTAIPFPAPPADSTEVIALRGTFRAFLDQQLKDRTPRQRSDNWYGYDRGFSRAMGQAGYLGMTWPKQYGGHERSAFERAVIVEECLAAGAPVGAHWIADRQSGPSILKFGTEAQKQAFLPRIAAGELSFGIGMSEPDSGSDLAATRTKAVKDGDVYRVTGTKVWTSFAHEADYVILFCRTSGTPADRHMGTSQLLIDLKNTPGLTIKPIIDLAGQHHFNEMHFEDAVVPADMLLGEEGQGWDQVMSELAFERSGPERFLSSIELMVQLIEVLKGKGSDAAQITVGRVTARLAVLRRLSRSVAGMLQEHQNANLQA